MKQITYLIVLTFLISCGQEELETNSQLCTDTDYNVEFNVQLNEVVCFPDGNSFQVKTIKNQFCPCDWDCIWAGQLEVMVETTDSEGQKDLFTFGSSTYLDTNKIFDGYTIREFTYLYDGEPDTLPLCEGVFDAENTELIMQISLE